MKRDERRVRSPHVVNIEDLRRVAARRVPRVMFDYVDGGGEGEITLRENVRAFEEVSFRPRNAVAVGSCDLRTKVLGQDLSMPVMLAPCGFSSIMHPEGELAAARAAGKAGTAYVLSTMSGHALEDVAKAASGPLWYQLYLVGGRLAGEAAIERARAAGYKALLLTIDTATFGMRERDIRNGAAVLLGKNKLAALPFLPQLLAHPAWLARFLLGGRQLDLPNVVVPGRGPLPLSVAHAGLAQSVVTWDEFGWIREAWPGPIVVKGVLTADDARRALAEGAAAVVVSNHGGRQLDSVSATLRALPEVVAAVNGRAEVLLDGGVRRGLHPPRTSDGQVG